MNRKKVAKLSLLFLFLILFSSCFKISATLIGIKQRKPFKVEKMIRKSYEYQPKAIQVALFDSNSYKKAVDFFENDISKIGIFIHPLFYLVFDKNDSLASFMAICDTDIHGALKMTWRDNNMGNFPPLYNTHFKKHMTFSDYYSWLHVVDKKSDVSNTSYKVIVMWSRLPGRQTKYLMSEIRENLQLSKDDKVDVIMVNCDDLLALSEFELKGKRK